MVASTAMAMANAPKNGGSSNVDSKGIKVSRQSRKNLEGEPHNLIMGFKSLYPFIRTSGVIRSFRSVVAHPNQLPDIEYPRVWRVSASSLAELYLGVLWRILEENGCHSKRFLIGVKMDWSKVYSDCLWEHVLYPSESFNSSFHGPSYGGEVFFWNLGFL